MKKQNEKEIREEVDRRLKEIDQLKKEAQKKKFEFESLGEMELIKKIQRSKSPYVGAQWWTSNASPGDLISYSVFIANPIGDPSHSDVFVSIFFGVANFLNNIGAGLSGRYTGWPVLTSERFTLNAGASTTKTFSIQIPTGIVTSTTYFGNGVVWKRCFYDVGDYFDRSAFYINVT
ncbi:MAG: hypothetical protein JSV88_33885 [Candidatus Aminicenantes bacterium]|nr:MAG: hypothetical protein JSV88_33885 [Candidatus Aminicenantes bacterium]